jgi:hypothetical protein
MIVSAPIAVGGIGGSGTRVVAAILREAAFYIGDDLNQALDNLWFTLLFKHRSVLSLSDSCFDRLVSIFVTTMQGDRSASTADLMVVDELAMQDRGQHEASWLQERARRLRHSLATPKSPSKWGWKEPNTHIVAGRLVAALPDLKYIHVVRNGLDMAYSANQNQPRFWGPLVSKTDDCAITPRNSLAFWCWAHSRIIKVGEQMGSRFLLVRFEDLCFNPESEIRRILSFADITVDAELVTRARRLVAPPASIGRYKSQPLDVFNLEDVRFVRECGFEVQ